MKRRDFLRKAAAAPAAGMFLGPQSADAVVPVKRPNVLVIHVDQHRIDCLGAYGNRQVETPNIDSLAGDGVRYDNSFCPYPVCTPSRYSLITGLPVFEHRGWTNHSTLPPGTETFPNLLRRAGYRTKAVGKMHYTPTYADVGFDEMELAEQNGPGRWDDDYHRYLQDRGLVDRNDLEDQLREYRDHAPKEYWETFGALESNLPEEHHSTTWIGERAVETVQGWSAGRPGMLMVGFIKPHHPFDPPRRWAEKYDPDEMSILPGWIDEPLQRDLEFNRGYFPNADLTPAALRRVTAYYYATISQIDWHVGRIIEVLKRKRIYDSTMIVFTSDHGEYMGFHHMVLKGNHMYDPLAKVPLIVKYPGGNGAGTTSAGLVSNVDLAPTILNAAGVSPADGMKGLDLAKAPDDREVVFCEYGRGNPTMARTREKKLIVMGPKRGSRNLFFEFNNDPMEMDDLGGDPGRQSEIAALADTILAWRPARKVTKPYLDEDAPQIDRPNVPSRDRSHREAIMGYYREKMNG